MLDPKKVQMGLWDSTYLPKYRLTIFQYNGHITDGNGYFFLVEDSSNVFFTIRHPYNSDITTFVPRAQILEMLSDSLFQFEPLEYEFSDFENYINECNYFKDHLIDLEVLDTLIKMKYTNTMYPVKVVRDSIDISTAIKINPGDESIKYKSKLKDALFKTLNRTNNRIYRIGQSEFLFIDYDPFYSGNFKSELFRDTSYTNETRNYQVRLNSLARRFNLRFIRIRH